MITREFDPSKPYRYVTYGRMSTEDQNPRSPEQQFQTIEDTRARLRYPWIKVNEFRDDGRSGRYFRKRSGFQRMLEQISTGALQIDLIVVDTLERFGRMNDLAAVRQELLNRHGVLIVTADSRFADPMSAQGHVLGAIEALRSTEAARIKAHDVRRGKRDAARQGHWPGGPAPFGFRIRSVFAEKNGRQEFDHSLLEPDPETRWISALAFQNAHATGCGVVRLARFLNDHSEIPQRFKPFCSATVGRWLDNPIYKGVLRLDLHSTDVIDDARVVRRNPEEEILYVEGFCEALVADEIWNGVHGMRHVRGERMRRQRQAARNGGSKLIAPLAAGIVLKYTLTGLVRCGHCWRAMDPSASSPYVTKAGETRLYVSYVCPGYLNRICDNCRRVPEDWLRQEVVQTVRQRLFPTASSGGGQLGNWFQPLYEEVRRELDRLATDRPDQRSAWAEELESIRRNIQGWTMTLGRPDLDGQVRRLLEGQVGEAITRQTEIEAQLAAADAAREHTQELLDPRAVLDRLDRLQEVLAGTNPTMANLLLSLHIDRIDCHRDGHVVMRTCRLGALTGLPDLLRSDGPVGDAHPRTSDATVGTPRRRALLRVDQPILGGDDLRGAAAFAADPDRFAGLDPRWFWEDTFQIPRRMSWAEEHAAEVAAGRKAGLTIAKLAEDFGKTVPTIRKALRYAAASDESLRQLPDKMPRQRWHEVHAVEVAELESGGMSVQDLAMRFGKCKETIRKALEYAAQAAEPRPSVVMPVESAIQEGSPCSA